MSEKEFQSHGMTAYFPAVLNALLRLGENTQWFDPKTGNLSRLEWHLCTVGESYKILFVVDKSFFASNGSQGARCLSENYIVVYEAMVSGKATAYCTLV